MTHILFYFPTLVKLESNVARTLDAVIWNTQRIGRDEFRKQKQKFKCAESANFRNMYLLFYRSNSSFNKVLNRISIWLEFEWITYRSPGTRFVIIHEMLYVSSKLISKQRSESHISIQWTKSCWRYIFRLLDVRCCVVDALLRISIPRIRIDTKAFHAALNARY